MSFTAAHRVGLAMGVLVCAALAALLCELQVAHGQTGADSGERVRQARGRVDQLRVQQREQERMRAVLLKEEAELLRQQAQLVRQIPEIQKDLAKPLSPDQRNREKCSLKELTAKFEQTGNQLRNLERSLSETRKNLSDIGRQISQTSRAVDSSTQDLSREQQQQQQQQQQRAEQDRQRQEEQSQRENQQQQQTAQQTDKLSVVMNQPTNTLNGLPIPPGASEGPRRLVLLDAYPVVLIPPTTSWTFDLGASLVTYDNGLAGHTHRTDVVFTMSDSSIQSVRVRLYKDSSTPASPLGLFATAGPSPMNAVVANMQTTFAGLPNITIPAGFTMTGHGVIDVPSDPSIQPLILYIINR